MSYSPEELLWIARIVNEWDAEIEAELLAELRIRLDVMPQTALGVQVETVKNGFEEFHMQMLRRRASLLVLRQRASQSCDQLIAQYLPEVTRIALWLPQQNLPFPSGDASPINQLDARQAFISLLQSVHYGLRILGMQIDPLLTVALDQPNFEYTPIQGYELCADVELQRMLYRFDQMKSFVWESPGDPWLLDLLNDLFVGIRDALTDFVNAFTQNPVAATLGTIDGILEGLGFYALVDTVIFVLEGTAYVAHNFVDSVRIAAGEFPTWEAARPPEWGARRAYAADVFWLAVEGLGGEDVRTSAAFQDTRNVAQPVTTVVTFFQGIRGIYNILQGVGGVGGAVGGVVASSLADIVQSGSSGAAALQLVGVADSVPWVSAADVVNAVRATILAFRASDDGGNGGGDDDIRETPERRRVSDHIFDRSSDELQHFDPRNPEDLQQIDDIIDDPIGTFVTRQRDGAGVYIRRVGDNDWTLVIYNEENNNIVTAIRHMDFDQIVGRATNYGFDAPPRNWRIFNE